MFDGQDWAEQGPEIDVADFAAAFATAETRMKTRPGARSVNIIRLIHRSRYVNVVEMKFSRVTLAEFMVCVRAIYAFGSGYKLGENYRLGAIEEVACREGRSRGLATRLRSGN
jgi:hypothetical protein